MIASASEIKFHPSSLGELMTGVKTNKPVEKSVTCKRKLVKIYREMKYGRYYNYSNKYTEKGTKMEEDGITLVSRVLGKRFTKFNDRISNDWLTGQPDIIHGNHIIDIKCSWSLDTLPHACIDEIPDEYEYQGRAYMDLTGAELFTVAYCLVNATGRLVIREKEKLYYDMDCPDHTNESYMNRLKSIERNMIFDMAQFKRDNPNFDYAHDEGEWQFDIPMDERLVMFTIQRDESEMQKIYSRLAECRSWMDTNLLTKNKAQ